MNFSVVGLIASLLAALNAQPSGQGTAEESARLGPGQPKGCWDPVAYGKSVENCTPDIPQALCSHCPLIRENIAPKTWDNHGNFLDCKHMFDVENAKCQKSLKKYIDRTPCDTVVQEAYEAFFNSEENTIDPNDYEDAWQILDRFVYTNCEFCCDAIPCGVEDKKYWQVWKDPDLELIDVARYNAPLHFYYDNCLMYPDWSMMRSQFDTEFDSQLEEDEEVDLCDIATKWKQGSDSEKVEYEKTFNPAMKVLAKSFGCGWKQAWDGCAYMEDHMGRLTEGDENC